MKIKIEKNIPIPTGRDSLGISDTIRKLHVGDSFETEAAQRTNAMSAARNIGIKVTTRKQENGKLRVWRIK